MCRIVPSAGCFRYIIERTAACITMLVHVPSFERLPQPEGIPMRRPRRDRPSATRRAVAALTVAAGLAVTACGDGGGGLPSPRGDISTGQALLDIGDLVVQLREENAGLQAQIDSLRDVVVRQDTILRRLALQAGMPVPP
jgi:hypothetical protein